MRRALVIFTVLSIVLAGASACVAASSPQARSASGQAVWMWNEIGRAQAAGNPLQHARVLAIMHAAQHDAVNGAVPRYETHASNLSDPDADAEAAAVAAAHAILVSFFPENQASLDAQFADSLAGVPDGLAEDAGAALGRAVARLHLQRRANDGFNGSDPFTPTPGPGVWQPTPSAFAPMLEPQFQNVAPFTLNDRTQFLPPHPPALTSATYTRDFNEVKRFGQDISSARTADQTHLGHFWAESSPVGWSRVGNIISSRRGYDLHETARLQALLTMAMADGFIVGWFQKRNFAFWRPVTAIPEADTDGNPSTTADAGWRALRATPPLPDYPSTHSLLGGAAAEILRRFTGSDRFRFCMKSTTAQPAGTQRCWETFTQAELENGESRVMVGFHFRSACDTGVDVGRKIGQFAIDHSLRPLPNDEEGS